MRLTITLTGQATEPDTLTIDQPAAAFRVTDGALYVLHGAQVACVLAAGHWLRIVCDEHDASRGAKGVR